MFTLIRYHILCALRNNSVVIWVVAFPILLSTILSVMLQGMTSNAVAENIPVGVVADAAYAEAPELREALEALAGEGDADWGAVGSGADAGSTTSGAAVDSADAATDADAHPLLALTVYDTAAAAEEALLADDITAYITVSGNSVPTMHVSPTNAGTTQQAVVQAVLDRYLQIGAGVGELMVNDPATLADSEAIERLVAASSGGQTSTKTLDVLRTDPSEMSRYFYAVLGFSAVMGCSVATGIVERVRANATPQGVRCQVAAASPARQLVAAFAASWTINFCCMLLDFAYLRLVLDVSFGGREALVPAACALCSLATCALGMVIGALPGLSRDAKGSAASALATLLSLPAGLYGTPALELSDWLGQNAPLLQRINPAVQASEAFFDLAYYDSLAPFAATAATLAAMAAVLLALAAFFMRRPNYAHL